MIRKLIAIVLAVLINCAVLAWFNTWGMAVVANAVPPQRTDTVLILPTVTVRPTRAQIEMLRRDAAPPMASSITATGVSGIQTLVMPDYSLVGTPGAVRNG